MKNFHRYSVLLGILLLGVLVWEVGPTELWGELGQVGWGLVPFILLEGVADLFHTLGWRRCLSGPHRTLPFFRIFGIRMAGTSINYLTPTAGLGGEVTKGTLLSSAHQGPEAASGVLIGKLSYALAQLVFVVLGSAAILSRIDLPRGVWAVMLAGTLLLAGGMIGFLAVQKYGALGTLVRWTVARHMGGRALEKAAAHVTKVDHELKLFYRDRPWDLPLSMLWHIVGMACGIVQSWYFLSLLTDQASVAMAAGICFLGSWLDLLSFALPYNIGVLEATRIIVFRTLGFHSALGLTYGIALRLEQIFWAGLGLLIYTTLLVKREEGEIRLRREAAENDG
jgi:hypothetical protein